MMTEMLLIKFFNQVFVDEGGAVDPDHGVVVAASHDVGEGGTEGAGGFEVAAAAGDEMNGSVFFDGLVVVDGPGAFVGMDVAIPNDIDLMLVREVAGVEIGSCNCKPFLNRSWQLIGKRSMESPFSEPVTGLAKRRWSCVETLEGLISRIFRWMKSFPAMTGFNYERGLSGREVRLFWRHHRTRNGSRGRLSRPSKSPWIY